MRQARAVLVGVCRTFCGDPLRAIRLAETAIEPGAAQGDEVLWERHCGCGCSVRVMVAARSVGFLDQSWDRIHGRWAASACRPASPGEALETRESWHQLVMSGGEAGA